MPWKACSTWKSAALCCSPARGRSDDRSVPGVRDIPQDRLQDLRPYKEHGLGPSRSSRRPVRYANQLPHQIEGLIVRLKAEKPHWGARKIRELLVRRLAATSGCRPRAPSMRSSTAMAWSTAAAGRTIAHEAPAVGRDHPNDLWCADFKGEFVGNTQYCYPLTVTDHASRYLLLCEALESIREETASHRL